VPVVPVVSVVERSGGVVGRPGGAQVAEMQRSRMLSSAVQVVSEYGYQRMSVARVAGRARVSRRTFYDLFEDREDCFLAAFEDAVSRAQELVTDAYEGERGAWRERVRAGLGALLVFLDEDPALRSLLIVDALKAGPRVLSRRAEILEGLAMVVQDDGSHAKSAREFPPLTGEGVVGAVFSVIHTRLSVEDPGRLIELLSSLMGIIVLPYLGALAARRELERPIPEPTRAGKDAGQATSASSVSVVGDPLLGLPMRLTYRTMCVLSAIGEHPGASNRRVSELAGASDQGQISKLLARLEKLGLIENTTGQKRTQPTGEPNAWRLTPLGEEIWHAIIMMPSSSATDHQVGV
jgi:AcrR family transcriptional regulator/DNA-binding MarR family transcriptional regulator